MERNTAAVHRKRNWLLTGAAILFAALTVVLCLLFRPKSGAAGSFVIRYGSGETLTVPAYETRTVVIRDGQLADAPTGEGKENVIRIENGAAWMEQANCPHRECMEQGVLNGETVETRPLGSWIVCAPHRVYIELSEDGG